MCRFKSEGFGDFLSILEQEILSGKISLDETDSDQVLRDCNLFDSRDKRSCTNRKNY